MMGWLSSLTPAETVFAALAIPATVILVLQSLMLLFGFGASHADGGDAGGIGGADGDFDVPDAPGDGFVPDSTPGDVDTGDGVALFSIRGIVAFFTIGGWLGLALLQSGMDVLPAALLSLLAGAAALYGIYWIMRASMRLQSSGNLELQNAIGLVGRVYIRVPANAKGRGKINITLQQRLCELEAVTFFGRDIKADQPVRVTAVQTDGALVVQPLEAEAAGRTLKS